MLFILTITVEANIDKTWQQRQGTHRMFYLEKLYVNATVHNIIIHLHGIYLATVTSVDRKHILQQQVTYLTLSSVKNIVSSCLHLALLQALKNTVRC